MTSRERIQATLNHRQPDRIPVDFGGTFETGISVTTTWYLRQALKLDGPDDRVKVTKDCPKYKGWKGVVLAPEFKWPNVKGREWSYEVELRNNIYATINEIFLEKLE